MELNLTTIKCPSCGAILQVDYNSSVICCEYCLTRIALKSESEIKKDLERKRAEKELELRKEHELAEAAQRQAERERREEYERAVALEERIKKEAELKIFTKKWLIIGGVLTFMGFLGLISATPIVILLFFGIAAFVHCHSERIRIKAEIAGNISLPKLLNYTSLSCNEVKDALQSAGFSNIKCVQSNKLPEHIEDKSTKVQSVIINGKRVQTLHGYCAPNAEIRIMYDFVIKLPSLSRYKESDYGFLVEALERAGFTNIKCESLNDLVLGIMKKPGKIESVTIGSSDVYSETGDWSVSAKWYLPDIKITIRYHSLNR